MKLIVAPRRAFLLAALALGVLVVLGAAVWAWVQVPALYPAQPPDREPAVAATREATRSQAIVTTRASVLAALAGLGALVTIGINYRNSQTTNRTFRIAERGHLTDRYTKAIEQLGSTEGAGSLAIRLGGIYALQQFATETERAEDQTTVVEVLSAFVRTNLPSRDTGDLEAESVDAETEPADPEIDSAARSFIGSPPPDVLAAISVLAHLPDRVALRADFGGIDHSALRFSGARLAGANFRQVAMPGVNLSYARLTGANFSRTDLSDADLTAADLRDADLSYARLTRANLTGANLAGADLTGTSFGADTDVVSFGGSNEANLLAARLSGARGLVRGQLSEGQQSKVWEMPAVAQSAPRTN